MAPEGGRMTRSLEMAVTMVLSVVICSTADASMAGTSPVANKLVVLKRFATLVKSAAKSSTELLRSSMDLALPVAAEEPKKSVVVAPGRAVKVPFQMVASAFLAQVKEVVGS